MNHLPIPPLAFNQSPSERDHAYSRIRELIELGTLISGDSLSERGLSESLGIGRTPVREAIKSLAREGLLEIVPMRGTFVRQLTMDDLREIHEIRLALESMAASLAAERGSTADLDACAADLRRMMSSLNLNEESFDVDEAQRIGWAFHEAMFQAANNKRLHELYRNLRAQNGLALQKIEGYDLQRTKFAIQEHLSIYEAIESRQSNEASRLVKRHLTNGLQTRLRTLTAFTNTD